MVLFQRELADLLEDSESRIRKPIRVLTSGGAIYIPNHGSRHPKVDEAEERGESAFLLPWDILPQKLDIAKDWRKP